MQQFDHSVIYTGPRDLLGEIEEKEPQSSLKIQKEGKTYPLATVLPYSMDRPRAKRLCNINIKA